ncbi:MAG: VWA domain-containing protein [Firmicutes bacterium]|nr:VWA domain-containing protein [Bacillota bacterium]
MELRYSFVIFIGIVLVIVLLFFRYKKKVFKYESGKRIANTKYVKKLPFYQNLLKKYKMLLFFIEGLFIVTIIFSFLLLSRPVFVDKVKVNEYNRDIFLCMDVSFSVNDLNKEIVDALKDTVNNLKGERFGISIFNTTSVLLVPLTDDYDYVLDSLDKIYESIEAINNYDYSSYYTYDYIIAGTVEGSNYYGGSLIGDGLVTCIDSFSDLEEDPDRTRIVIFSTDNEVPPTSKPVYSLEEAAKYTKEKNVTVYGIATANAKYRDKVTFRNAVELTGGTLYEESTGSTVSEIVKNIEKTSKNLTEGKEETMRTDIPEVPFMILLFSMLILFILTKRVAYYDN